MVSARSWGRAGIAALALTACAPAMTSSARPGGPWATAMPVAHVAQPPRVVTGALAVPGVATTASAPVPALAPPAPSGTGVWGVVIGIDDYPGTSHDLRSARNDAVDMDAALARYGVPADHRIVLADGWATAADIGRALDWLVANAGPHATAVFFFAGHVRKLGPSTEALVGADGGLLRDTELAARLAGLRAARTWLVVAGCYGGGFTEALAPGRILTGAAPADRLAFESPTFHRSYLVEYLVRRAMLDGRASASVEAAFAWATTAIAREHPGRQPVQFDEVPGALTLGPAPGPPPPAPAPAARSGPRRGAAPAPTTTTTTPPPEEGRSCILTLGSTVRCPDRQG